jgi:hypothetical protein
MSNRLEGLSGVYSVCMTQEELDNLADNWIRYRYAPRNSAEAEATAWATDLYDLEYDDPESLWLLILNIHGKDQSARVQEVLSAGPVEDLLAKHGEKFIDRVEAEAQKDPKFAKLLGGVWKNDMTDEIWNRLQAVWDRSGWDGIPE